jgi:hypothetical protein
MQPNIMKSAMQNGLIMGVIFSINFLLSTQKNSTLIFLTYVIAIIIVTILHKQIIRFRDTECNEIISYGKAFSYIILVFFYAALISTPVKYIYVRYINPDFLITLAQDTMKMFEAFKIPMSNVEIEQSQEIFKPLNFSLLYIWSNIFLGAVTGLIMAAFVKKNKNISHE